MENIDAKMAYQAMFTYLEKYYNQTKSSDIGALLGSMQLLEDGHPADKAIWNEWINIISDLIDEKKEPV